MNRPPLFTENFSEPEPQKPQVLSYGATVPQTYIPQPIEPPTQIPSNVFAYSKAPTPKALQLTEEYKNQARKTRTLTTVFLILGTIILSIIFAGAAFLGSGITFFLALIPLAGIIAATVWIGKWDPEPVWLRSLTFLYGAVGAVIITFALSAVWSALWGELPIELAAPLQAPIVEELAKGLVVLAIGLFYRKHFSGPVDGIVYMILAAAGFAFTENILYFTNSIVDGSGALSQTFFMRGIMSPFAHPMFSLPMGIMIGLAVIKNKGYLMTVLYFLIGYVPAMILHGLWNGSATIITDPLLWFGYYALVQIPIFLGAVFVIRYFRNAEANRTYQTLTSYAWEGLFTKQEVEALGSWVGRKYATKWAKNKSAEASYLVKSLNRDVVALTNVKELLNTGKTRYEEQEKRLLKKIQEDKQQLMTV